MSGVLRLLAKRRELIFAFALTGVAVLLPSCGNSRKPVYPVHGKMFDSQDKPAVGAMIIFHPVGASGADVTKAVGYVQDDGSFTLTTYEKDDGAPEGEYVATVEWRAKRESPAAPEPPDRFGGQLSNPANSTYKFKVDKQSDNVLEPIKLPPDARNP